MSYVLRNALKVSSLKTLKNIATQILKWAEWSRMNSLSGSHTFDVLVTDHAILQPFIPFINGHVSHIQFDGPIDCHNHQDVTPLPASECNTPDTGIWHQNFGSAWEGSSAMWNSEEEYYRISHRKTYRTKIPQPSPSQSKGFNRPQTCKNCSSISKSGTKKNLHSNNVKMHSICQSNHLIYCLECNWCNIKYTGLTKNRIIDRFHGHMFDVKHQSNTKVARHFARHQDTIDPRMTIHILEYFWALKDAPRSNFLREKKGISLESQTKHYNPLWP